jgi:hypothetical protein
MTERTARPNGAVLTAHEAMIQTATVEIHTLRVGKKQVTMGMFRQLPYEELIDWEELWAVSDGYDVDTAFFIGTPWGHVNYWWQGDFPRRCTYTNEWGQWQGRGEKLHLVWQWQGQLYRCVLCEWLPDWVCRLEANKAYGVTDLRTAWYKVWRRLEALPQLFIAV